MIRQSALQRGVRRLTSRKHVLVVVHPLNVAMIGMLTALVCLVYAASLLFRQFSSSTLARFWTSESASACVTTAATLYIMSHALVMFERHLAGSRPQLHAQLVIKSTAVVGVSALWLYSVLVACIPIIRCVVSPPDVELEAAGFRRGYVAYLAVQFIIVVVVSVLLAVSVGQGRHSDVARRFQTGGVFDEDRTRRCIAALVVCAACWTSCVTFQLVDQLGCVLPSDHLDREAIIGIVARQMSPLVGLSTGLLLPIVYLCRCPLCPGCCNITTFNIRRS